MVVPPVTVPGTVVVLIVTVVATELASVHTPLCTTALNWVVAVNASEVYVAALFSIVVQSVPFREDSHLKMFPVCVPNVNSPLVLPVQMAVTPVTVPGTVTGCATTEAVDE